MNKMIHILMLFIVCSLSAVQAQHSTMNKQEFRQKQKQFLTEKASLSPQEAKAFFPLYFELQDKKHDLNKAAWINLRKEQKSQLTDEQYSEIIDDVAKARIAADELEYDYIKKYKEILPAKKIYRIQRAEMHFHRALLQQYRHKSHKNRKGQD